MRFKMPEGYKAEFEHRQFKKRVTVELYNKHVITPRGYTHCILKTEQGVIVSEGLTWCRNIDQFSKSIGRQISLGRALKGFYEGKGFSIRPYQLYQHND